MPNSEPRFPTCILADDEPFLNRYLADQLHAAWPELRIIGMAANGLEADELITRYQPDVAFLDIQMPGRTGLEVAQGIEGSTQVVFVTAFDAYALQAFEDGAVDYVLKPVTPQRLAKCVLRLRERCLTPTGAVPDLALALSRLMQSAARVAPQLPYLRYVRAHERTAQGEHLLQIVVDEVLYFEAADKYTCVVLPSGEKLLRTAISDLEAQLDPSQFKRIHRGTLVNLAHIHATRRDEAGRMWVRLKQHPRELAVSRAYHAVFGRM